MNALKAGRMKRFVAVACSLSMALGLVPVGACAFAAEAVANQPVAQDVIVDQDSVRPTTGEKAEASSDGLNDTNNSIGSVTGDKASEPALQEKSNNEVLAVNEEAPSVEGEMASDASEGETICDFQEEETSIFVSDPVASISGSAHVQNVGWANASFDENTGIATFGTTGKGLRLEGIKISCAGFTLNYRTHVQDVGWQGFVSNGGLAGTTGRALRLEALQITLSEEQAAQYDVYYRAHAQDFGWMAWAKNGASVGTEGMAKRLEALQVAIVPKGQGAPSSSIASAVDYAFYSKTQGASKPSVGDIVYKAHVQNIGWQSWVVEGSKKTAGTTGRALRLEGLRVSSQIDGVEVVSNAHVSNIGWQAKTDDVSKWFGDDQVVGTTGRNLPVEALQLALTGENSSLYDLYYRVHVSNVGWLDWAKNGEKAGTVGFAASVEAVEICLVGKDEEAPGDTDCAFLNANGLSYSSVVTGRGWGNTVVNGATSGTSGSNLSLEAFKAQLSEVGVSGGISYQAHVAGVGWEDAVSDGAVAGEIGKSVEAIKVNLTGSAASRFDIYYRVYVDGLGWLGWAANGEVAGSTGCALSVRAVQMRLAIKGAPAPGDRGLHEVMNVSGNGQLNIAISKIIGYSTGKNLRSCFNYVVNNYTYSSRDVWPSYAGWTEDYALRMINDGAGNCYSYACLFLYLAKACGYSGSVYSGQVPLARGGLGPHGWTELYIDGVTYVCDPDLQYELGTNGYMFTYSTSPITYYDANGALKR